jgi:hypothetical protein
MAGRAGLGGPPPCPWWGFAGNGAGFEISDLRAGRVVELRTLYTREFDGRS